MESLEVPFSLISEEYRGRVFALGQLKSTCLACTEVTIYCKECIVAWAGFNQSHVPATTCDALCEIITL